MFIKNKWSFICLFVFFLSKGVFSNETLIVEVTDIVKKRGSIVLAVFDNSKDLKKEIAFKTYTKEVSGSTVVFHLNDLKKGKYAIQLYQDLNGNQECDRNFIGMPKEPIGLSNNVRPKFSRPTFEQMKFEYKDNNQKISIQLFEI